jgi:hypothetical protein
VGLGPLIYRQFGVDAQVTQRSNPNVQLRPGTYCELRMLQGFMFASN